MDLIVTLIIGGVIGWLASILMRSDGQMGVLANILVGIVGSFLGSWLVGVLGIHADGAGRYVVALVGAMLLIGIVRALGLMRPRGLAR
jgi:uncharacterized membrane protein YeaQ/YmgE (transglycosylase-associated protein family)